MAKRQPWKVELLVQMPDGALRKFADFPPEEQREIGIRLNRRAMAAIGYYPESEVETGKQEKEAALA